MIYLLGGPPRARKTTVAETMARDHGIPWVGTDAFAFVLEHAAPQLGVGLSSTPEHRRAVFGPYLRALVHCQTLTTPRYLIEGEAIAPADVPGLARDFPVVACFVGYTTLSVDDLLIKRPSWVEHLDSHAQSRLVGEILERSRELETECASLGLTYVDVSGHHESAIRRVSDCLLAATPTSQPNLAQPHWNAKG